MAAGLNTYAYVGDNPLAFFDPDGRRSVVRNRGILPEDGSVPAVSIPNNVGAEGISTSNAFFHTYDVITSSTLCADQVVDGLVNNPTPGDDTPASPSGTVNDVGDLPTTDGTNLVRSYFVASPDPTRFTDVIVNYTITGEHGFEEGFVIRFGEISSDGATTIRSYGEGNAFFQAPIFEGYWDSIVEDVWQQNHQDINNNPTTSCSCSE